jgi:hypothetical protein
VGEGFRFPGCCFPSASRSLMHGRWPTRNYYTTPAITSARPNAHPPLPPPQEEEEPALRTLRHHLFSTAREQCPAEKTALPFPGRRRASGGSLGRKVVG